jgi:hypothetical protein
MKTLLSLLIAAAITTSANAQTPKAGPNGGMLAGKSHHQVELVTEASELSVYLLHDGKMSTVKGANLRVVIQQAGSNTTVQLTNVDNKKLVGKLAAPLAKGAIVVITGKDDHGDAISARYTIN